MANISLNLRNGLSGAFVARLSADSLVDVDFPAGYPDFSTASFS